MKIPRFGIRRLMILIVVIAVMMSYVRTRERWTRYRVRAAYHAGLEDFYRDSIDDPSGWLRMHPGLDGFDPEPPPISPHDPHAWEPDNCRLLMDYHARMCAYWEAQW